MKRIAVFALGVLAFVAVTYRLTELAPHLVTHFVAAMVGAGAAIVVMLLCGWDDEALP